MQRSLEKNIIQLYLIKLSKWLMLIMPVVALFYADNGLDDFDIYLLQAIYSISVAVLEIPSGYMADVIGRRTSLVLGSILGTLGFVLYSFSHSFGGFLFAEIILGIGGSFISGSDSALLYDSLAAMGRQNRYLQYEGRITSLGNFAETAAAICGGVIAVLLSYRTVYVTQACIAAMAIPASLMLLEPPRKRLDKRPGIQQILQICRYALFENKRLSSTLLLSSIIGTATLCMAWTCQVYFVRNGLDEISITPLWVVLNLTAATVAAYAAVVVERLGERRALLVIAFGIPMGYVMLGGLSLFPALIALVCFYGIRGYATPFLKDLTNRFCGSETRATVLSIRSMIIRTSFSLLGPAIGYLSGKISLDMALILVGVALLFLSGAVVLWVIPVLDIKKS